jgi:hypothetical protein
MSKSLLALLLLAACSSSTSTRSAPDATSDRDWCAPVPAEVANLALGGAAHNPWSDGDARNGGCTWDGDGGASLIVRIDQNDVDRVIFDDACDAFHAPPATAPFGLAACYDDKGDTVVFADEHTILTAVGYKTTDTDHHFALLEAVYDRVKR